MGWSVAFGPRFRERKMRAPEASAPPPNIQILGASSDHLVVTSETLLTPSPEVGFGANYGALVKLVTHRLLPRFRQLCRRAAVARRPQDDGSAEQGSRDVERLLPRLCITLVGDGSFGWLVMSPCGTTRSLVPVVQSEPVDKTNAMRRLNGLG